MTNPKFRWSLSLLAVFLLGLQACSFMRVGPCNEGALNQLAVAHYQTRQLFDDLRYKFPNQEALRDRIKTVRLELRRIVWDYQLRDDAGSTMPAQVNDLIDIFDELTAFRVEEGPWGEDDWSTNVEIIRIGFNEAWKTERAKGCEGDY